MRLPRYVVKLALQIEYKPPGPFHRVSKKPFDYPHPSSVAIIEQTANSTSSPFQKAIQKWLAARIMDVMTNNSHV